MIQVCKYVIHADCMDDIVDNCKPVYVSPSLIHSKVRELIDMGVTSQNFDPDVFIILTSFVVSPTSLG